MVDEKGDFSQSFLQGSSLLYIHPRNCLRVVINYRMLSCPSLIGRRQQLLPSESEATINHVAQLFVAFDFIRDI